MWGFWASGFQYSGFCGLRVQGFGLSSCSQGLQGIEFRVQVFNRAQVEPLKLNPDSRQQSSSEDFPKLEVHLNGICSGDRMYIYIYVYVYIYTYEPLSKLLVYPLISPIVVPYRIPYITPFKEFRL